jgi:RNA polymerase sigma-70 factor, ECF subfamily
MVMTDVSTFCPDPPKRPSRDWSTSSFVGWFRRQASRPPNPPPKDEEPASRVEVADAANDSPMPHQVFQLWGMAVWRSLKLRGVRERDVEDVLQDVFIVVLKRWDSFRGESSRKTWVFGIVHGVVANYHRKNRRAAAEPALVGPEMWEILASPAGQDPASRSAARQELEWLRGVLSEFRDEDRALFVLRHIDGCTVSEAAQIVGMTASLANGRLLAVEKLVNTALTRHQARDAWRVK